ncbi:hypothetical protein AIIKEEIJ_05802 [Rhodococcus sp. YH1]|nr:hypothetical protein [Rhodococcus sp. YH1]
MGAYPHALGRHSRSDVVGRPRSRREDRYECRAAPHPRSGQTPQTVPEVPLPELIEHIVSHRQVEHRALRVVHPECSDVDATVDGLGVRPPQFREHLPAQDGCQVADPVRFREQLRGLGQAIDVRDDPDPAALPRGRLVQGSRLGIGQWRSVTGLPIGAAREHGLVLGGQHRVGVVGEPHRRDHLARRLAAVPREHSDRAEYPVGRRGDARVLQGCAERHVAAPTVDVDRGRHEIVRDVDLQHPAAGRDGPGLAVTSRGGSVRGMQYPVDRIVRFRGQGGFRDGPVPRIRRWGQGVEAGLDVHAASPRVQRLAEAQPAHDRGDRRAAEHHLAPQLRPGDQRPLHLQEGGGHPGRDPLRSQQAQSVRNLLPTRQGGEPLRVDLSQQSVKRGSRPQIEALDVDQPPVTRLHHHRDCSPGRFRAQHDLDVQGVALVHDDVESVQELAHRFRSDPVGPHRQGQVRIQLRESSRGHDRLVRAQIDEGGRHPVEIRQLDRVEVGEPQFPAHPVEHQRLRNREADAQSDDPHRHPAQPVLFGRRHLVPVAVQP